jgi:hypothetical protein
MLKIGAAVSVLNDDFAIENCRAALELGSFAHDTRITVAPIEAVAGASPNVALLDQKQRPVAVVLDLVYPAFSARRPVNECSELGFDEMDEGHANAFSSADPNIEVLIRGVRAHARVTAERNWRDLRD